MKSQVLARLIIVQLLGDQVDDVVPAPFVTGLEFLKVLLELLQGLWREICKQVLRSSIGKRGCG